MKTKKLSPAREKFLRRVEAGEKLICGASGIWVVQAWFEPGHDLTTNPAKFALYADLLAKGPCFKEGFIYCAPVKFYELHLTEAGKAALAKAERRETLK